jgi:hypothetical protein
VKAAMVARKGMKNIMRFMNGVTSNSKASMSFDSDLLARFITGKDFFCFSILGSLLSGRIFVSPAIAAAAQKGN